MIRSAAIAKSLSLTAAVLLIAVNPAHSAEKAGPAAEGQRCLPVNSIKRTKIVDDKTILFFTNSNGVYKNELPYRCPGLASADAFKYETSLTQLCDLDKITVLVQAGGLTPGASCGLGKFVPSADPAKVEAKK